MKVVKARMILSFIALSMLAVFPLLQGLITWRLVATSKDTGLNFTVYSNDFNNRIYCSVAGILWTLTASFGIMRCFIKYRKAFIWCGAFWIIIAILTAIFIAVMTTLSSTFIHSYKDLTTSERIEVESDKKCCFYTDEVERVDENRDSFIDYKIYANCPLINQTDPNIDWSNCEGENDDMVCFAYDFGIIREVNITSSIGVCNSDSDIIPFVGVVIVEFLYFCSTSIYAILYFIMFCLTKPIKHGYEVIDSKVRKDNK